MLEAASAYLLLPRTACHWQTPGQHTDDVWRKATQLSGNDCFITILYCCGSSCRLILTLQLCTATLCFESHRAPVSGNVDRPGSSQNAERPPPVDLLTRLWLVHSAHHPTFHRTMVNYDDIGHKPYRPRPYRPQTKSATDHISHSLYHIGHRQPMSDNRPTCVQS